jgi:DNA-binding LytR/AlgR family response regulator
MRVPANDFTSARAAGNYVEVRFGNGQHLARTTLTDLEKLLTEAGIDARRVHRSWLINHACLAEITPTGEGDVTLTLADGQRVPGSRRYRDRLEAA